MVFHQEPLPTRKPKSTPWWKKHGLEAGFWALFVYSVYSIYKNLDHSINVVENVRANPSGYAQAFAYSVLGFWEHHRDAVNEELDHTPEHIKNSLDHFRENERLFDVLDIDILVPASLVIGGRSFYAEGQRAALLDKILSSPDQWKSFQSRLAHLPYDQADQRAEKREKNDRKARR